jgi:TM2 domain-containing membrane protein YozV
MKTKSKTTAAILAFLLGGLGIHKFYLGQTLQGILYLVFCWTWIPLILSLIDFIIYLTMSEQAFQEKYCNGGNQQHQQTYYQPYQQTPYNAQGQSKFCPSCGTRVETGTRFCPNCGNQI